MGLFDVEYGQDQSEVDNTRITNTMLMYGSEEEMAEFKKLCKIGIADKFGDAKIDKGNITDFLLIVLREKYGSSNNS